MDGRSIRRLFLLRVQPADEKAVAQPLKPSADLYKGQRFLFPVKW
jgi:hypothetical protein